MGEHAGRLRDHLPEIASKPHGSGNMLSDMANKPRGSVIETAEVVLAHFRLRDGQNSCFTPLVKRIALPFLFAAATGQTADTKPFTFPV